MGFVKQPDCGTHALSQKLGIMLFLLAVLTAASAEPQIPLSPYYNPYLQYYPQYQVERQVPLSYYPRIPMAQARFSLGGFMQKGAAFTAMAAVTTSGSEMSAKTLRGDITFWQNPFTFNNAKFHVNLPNVAANKPIGIYIHAAGGDCGNTAATATGISTLTKLTTPFIQINGAYVDGSTNMFNLNGADGKTDISGRYISIRDLGMNCPACVIGCTGSGLS